MPAERLPPAQPTYVLRGHAAQVHALHFTHDNSRLFTGDADGWIVLWNLAYKRPAAVWKAHENAVLGIASWGADRTITHGRDHRLIAWNLSVADESTLDKILPVNQSGQTPPKPEILYTLDVNTLNFCSFAWCWDTSTSSPSSEEVALSEQASLIPAPILVSVPNVPDSDGIDIFQLPPQKRQSTVPANKNIKTGMVMALNIRYEKDRLEVVAGYESGHTMVFAQEKPGTQWQKLYSAQPHSQPVLSLSVSPSLEFYLTSSADSILAKHPLPSMAAAPDLEAKPLKLLSTKHSGQQGLRIRGDNKVFATAGWDARVRVYSVKTMKELAVLKWHKEGCYATAFANISDPAATTTAGPTDSESGTSSGETPDNMAVVSSRPSPTTDLALLRSSTATVSEQREQKAKSTHWLAVGSKDGKISLWDIY